MPTIFMLMRSLTTVGLPTASFLTSVVFMEKLRDSKHRAAKACQKDVYDFSAEFSGKTRSSSSDTIPIRVIQCTVAIDKQLPALIICTCTYVNTALSSVFDVEVQEGT